MIIIGKAANKLGVSVKILQRWDREHKLAARRTSTGRRYYEQDQLMSFLGKAILLAKERAFVAYCRVSSQAQRPDLRNQRFVITNFCVARGLANVEYIEEIGGGLNFKRPRFTELIDRICAGGVSTLILAHKNQGS